MFKDSKYYGIDFRLIVEKLPWQPLVKTFTRRYIIHLFNLFFHRYFDWPIADVSQRNSFFDECWKRLCMKVIPLWIVDFDSNCSKRLLICCWPTPINFLFSLLHNYIICRNRIFVIIWIIFALPGSYNPIYIIISSMFIIPLYVITSFPSKFLIKFPRGRPTMLKHRVYVIF